MMTNKNVLRQSQIIMTFGPGAMIDLPTRSVIIGGLERWDTRGDAFKSIREPRLVEKLEQRLRRNGRLPEGGHLTLRTPPVSGDVNGQQILGVEAAVFPTWFVCNADEREATGQAVERRRRLVQWSELNPTGGKRQFQHDDGRKSDVSPIRFVAACKKGHIEDVNWRWVVHGTQQCREPMWLEEKGTSADPRDTRIICECGRALSLEQLFQPGRLGACRGARPWLDDRDPDGCTENLKLLTRAATNAYFPQVVTIISLPEGEDELTRRVQENWDDLKGALTPDDVGQARRFNQKLRASLEKYSNEEVFSRLSLISGNVQQTASVPAKVAEFDVLGSGQSKIGSDELDSLLFAETLHRSTWNAHDVPWCRDVLNLVAVHRLREVTCLYGFTRFEAAPTELDDDLEDANLAVDGAPISLRTEWLPAVEQFGEGLFIQFDPNAVEEWSRREGVKHRISQLESGHRRWEAARGRQVPGGRGAAYTMLHSLSHILMMEIALECGYPATSLKERVYAQANPLRKQDIDRCGILIYTANTGRQGTLGGLVATANRFVGILKSALDRLVLCSNDPICADHDPDSATDDRALHGAACHSCLLIAETSCEARNLFLDRCLLSATVSGEDAAFF